MNLISYLCQNVCVSYNYSSIVLSSYFPFCMFFFFFSYVLQVSISFFLIPYIYPLPLPFAPFSFPSSRSPLTSPLSSLRFFLFSPPFFSLPSTTLPSTLLPSTSLPSTSLSSIRLVACLGEESGHNLIADLSRTQQLVEVLETGSIFNSKRYEHVEYKLNPDLLCTQSHVINLLLLSMFSFFSLSKFLN